MGGCTVSGQGQVQPQIDKTEAITACPKPEPKKEVRQFLGLPGCYCWFIPIYSDITSLLTDLKGNTRPGPVDGLTQKFLHSLNLFLCQCECNLSATCFLIPFHNHSRTITVILLLNVYLMWFEVKEENSNIHTAKKHMLWGTGRGMGVFFGAHTTKVWQTQKTQDCNVKECKHTNFTKQKGTTKRLAYEES